jgi:hypothetical protein
MYSSLPTCWPDLTKISYNISRLTVSESRQGIANYQLDLKLVVIDIQNHRIIAN